MNVLITRQKPFGNIKLRQRLRILSLVLKDFRESKVRSSEVRISLDRFPKRLNRFVLLLKI